MRVVFQKLKSKKPSDTGRFDKYDIISTKRIQAERLLMNLKQVELIKNVSIPAAAQPEEKKKKSWEYTVMAEYNSDSKDKSADENKSQSTDTSSTQSE